MDKKKRDEIIARLNERDVNRPCPRCQNDLDIVGITIDGRKIPLGFEQTVTENERVVTQFLRKLVERGLCYDQGLLVSIDGAKGLYNALKTVFSTYALIQRCQWHRRENVLSYLSKSDQGRISKLQKGSLSNFN